jgi:acyl-CoA synthetase (AMP-forming)/AMP-acid ligase II/alkylation response protein AidB-like acyl-CoA dehydrogenase/acyl carrier protein
MRNDLDVLWYPSIVDALSHWREVNPNKTAFTFLSDKGSKESDITFAELHRKVMAFASLLRAEQMEGQRIIIVLPSGIDYAVAFLSCLASGAIAVPLYPPNGKRDWGRLRTVIEDCQPKAVMLNRSVSDRYRNEFSTVLSPRDYRYFLVDELTLPAGNPATGFEIDPKRIAFLQYTSGSTGNAKGVMVSHENIMHNAHYMAAAMGNGMDSVDVSWLPFYHDMGLIGKVLQALSVGAHAVLMSPYSFLRNPICWLKAISDYKGTLVGAPNFAYDLCVDKVSESDIDSLDLSTLQVAYNGSEPIKATTMERFYQRFKRAGFRKEAFFPAYGLAEATLYVAGGPRHKLPVTLEVDRDSLNEGNVTAATLHPSSPDYADRVQSCVSVYEPFPDQTVRIVDPTTWAVLPERRVGEIWVKSRSIARGYWNKRKETAETFQAYTTDTGEGPFLRTGDLGFFHDGHLYIAGRIKELVIVNGINHYPQDIEETVQSLSDNFRVHSGAAFGFEDDKLAIIQGINRTKASPQELDDLISRIRQTVLQVHGISPSYVGLVSPGEIAKTSSGKIQRGFIRRRFLSGELPLLRSWKSDAARGELNSVQLPAAPEKHVEAAPREERRPVERAAAASSAASSSVVQEKVAWIHNYFKHRVNSYLIDERRTMPPYIVLDLGNQGLLGMLVPKKYGGLEFSTCDFLKILEAFGSKDLTLGLFVGLNNALGVRPILKFGTEALKERYLPILAAGRELGAFALTEPAAGSNPQAIQATAHQTASGTYRVSGTKYWSGSAAWCGVLNVFAKTVDGNGRATGITAFAVPQTSAGLRQGPEALTMGMRGMIQNTVFLEDVEVDPGQVLGKPGHGMGVAQDTMCYGRITIAAVCLGGMKLCYQMMLQYAGSRDVATGRLLQNPYTRSVLTETMHAIASVEALLYGVAARMDAGENVQPEILAVCKCVSTEGLWKAVDRTMQLAGGRGYIESNYIPQVFRDARIFRIFEGPTETLNHFIGSSAVKSTQLVRSYLRTLMDEAEVAELYDAVLHRVSVRHAAASGDTAMQHWHYLAVGEYVNQLVLYATCRSSVEPATRQWLREQVRNADLQLDATMSRYDDIGSVEAIRAFADGVDRQLGRREQTYPLPNGLLDPFLTPDSRGPAQATPAAAAAAAAVAPEIIHAAHANGHGKGASAHANGASAHANGYGNGASAAHHSNGHGNGYSNGAPAAHGKGAASPPVSKVPSPSATNQHDVQSFLGRWIAKRCGRPVEAIGPDMEFAALGLGSVDSFELSADLSRRYELDLDPTVFWNYPNIRELAGFVRCELEARQQ